MAQEHINGYALALFSLAKEEKKLKKVKEDSLEIIEALKANEEFLELLRSKRIEFDSKETMIQKAFKGADKNILNFLLIVAQKGNAKQVPHILTKLVSLINDELGIKEGFIYTVKKLSADEMKKIETKVSKQLGFKPTLINKLDPELISGFRVVVGDEVIEDSVASRLQQIKYELLREEK